MQRAAFRHGLRIESEMKRGPFIVGVSALGITLRDNKRNDEAGYTAKSQVVNYAQVNGSVVRGIPETDIGSRVRRAALTARLTATGSRRLMASS